MSSKLRVQNSKLSVVTTLNFALLTLNFGTMAQQRQLVIADQRAVTLSGGDAKRDRYQAFWAELPEHNAHNLVICHERFFLATTDPKHVLPFYLAMNVGAQNEGTQNESDDMPVALADRFVAMLNQAHDLPVLPQWAGTLWRAGLRSGLIEPITARGDIAAAFRVQSDGEPWGEIIRDAFETGDIAIPDDVPAAHSQEPKSASI